MSRHHRQPIDPNLRYQAPWLGPRRDFAPGLYLRAHYYDPTIGRFLTRDPLPGSTRDPQSLNAYPSVRDNPVNRIDPSACLP